MTGRSCRAAALTGFSVLLAFVAVGCGGDGTHRVTGKISFMGKPVPAGKIYFLPDSTKGNKGMTGYANIVDGSYDTGLKGSKGSVSGPVIIAVEGFDPTAAPAKRDAKADPEGEVTTKVLFARYELAAEMPEAASTKDIEVPDAAAKGPKVPKGTGPAVVP